MRPCARSCAGTREVPDHGPEANRADGLRDRAHPGAGAERRLHRADRRDRRRQIHPDRRAAAAAGRTCRHRRDPRGRPAHGYQRRVRRRRLAGVGVVAARGRHRTAGGAAAAPHRGHRRQEPRLDQRHARHGCADARPGRPPARYPRPARLAEPDAPGRGARAAGRLRRRTGRAPGRPVDCVARRAKSPGARPGGAKHPGARARAAAVANQRSGQAGPGRRRVGRAQRAARAPVQCPGADRERARGAGAAGGRR